MRGCIYTCHLPCPMGHTGSNKVQCNLNYTANVESMVIKKTDSECQLLKHCDADNKYACPGAECVNVDGGYNCLHHVDECPGTCAMFSKQNSTWLDSITQCQLNWMESELKFATDISLAQLLFFLPVFFSK